MKNTVSVPRKADPAAIWALAGVVAGGLSLISPGLGLLAGGGCVAAALWRSRPHEATSPLAAGDLAGPWPEGEPERVRQEVVAVWQRLLQRHEHLHRLLARLEARQQEWDRLLALGEANADTVGRAAYAQQGAVGRALDAVSAGVRAWAQVQQRWDELRGALVGLIRQDRLQAVAASETQSRLAEGRRHWDELQAAADRACAQLGQISSMSDEPAAWLQLAARADALASEAARLGKSGWGVALAATEWAAEVRGHAEATERPDKAAAAQAAAELAACVTACRQALDMVAEAAMGLTDTPLPVARPAELPEPGLEAVAERLDAASREGELSAGLAQEMHTTVGGWRQRAHRLVDDVAAARHLAAELLILSGHVRTAAEMAPCHLNRTLWCIADGDCERCALTRVTAADFPDLLGPLRSRQAPIRNTGRTIDLDPANGWR